MSPAFLIFLGLRGSWDKGLLFCGQTIAHDWVGSQDMRIQCWSQESPGQTGASQSLPQMPARVCVAFILDCWFGSMLSVRLAVCPAFPCFLLAHGALLRVRGHSDSCSFWAYSSLGSCCSKVCSASLGLALVQFSVFCAWWACQTVDWYSSSLQNVFKFFLVIFSPLFSLFFM